MNTRFNKGFTLIELMVVVVIIAILTSIVATSFAQAKAKSRDAKRISDLAQIQLALELAFDKCGLYPGVSWVGGRKVLIVGQNIDITCVKQGGSPYLLSDFLQTMPVDPSTGLAYLYEVYTPKVNYRLMAVLETSTGAAAGGAIGNIGNITCSAGNNYCVSPM